MPTNKDIINLQNSKQKKIAFVPSTPNEREGKDGDLRLSMVANKGLFMFYKLGNTWYGTRMEKLLRSRIGETKIVIPNKINDTTGELTRTEEDLYFKSPSKNKKVYLQGDRDFIKKDLRLNNVTNESKVTMFTDPIFSNSSDSTVTIKSTNLSGGKAILNFIADKGQDDSDNMSIQMLDSSGDTGGLNFGKLDGTTLVPMIRMVDTGAGSGVSDTYIEYFSKIQSEFGGSNIFTISNKGANGATSFQMIADASDSDTIDKWEFIVTDGGDLEFFNYGANSILYKIDPNATAANSIHTFTGNVNMSTSTGTLGFGSLVDTGESITVTKFVDEADGISSNDNDTTIPTSAAVKDYTDTATAALVDSAPATLDTLNELAAALNDDASFSTTITNSIATKVSLTGDETVAGHKKFSDDVLIAGTAANTGTNDEVSLGVNGNSLRIYTNYGYLNVGPQNDSWSHFYTDRAKYYFNHPITVDEGIISSYNEDVILRRSNDAQNQLLIGDDSLAVTLGGDSRLSIDSSGVVSAVELDISGDVDIDGTLEADVITVNGTALNTVIAGVTVTNATNATHVTVADNESTNEDNLIPFIENESATGNVGLESDGDFHYNPSTGRVTATQFVGTLMTGSQTNITSVGTIGTGTWAGTVIQSQYLDNQLTDQSSILNDSLVIGRDADNQIKFGTDNQITFEVDGGDNVLFKTGGEIEATSLDISGDVDVDGTLETDALTVNLHSNAQEVAYITAGTSTTEILWGLGLKNYGNLNVTDEYGVGMKFRGGGNTEHSKWAGIAAVNNGGWFNANDLVFYTNETEKFRIDKNGDSSLSGHFNITTGHEFKINDTSVLSNNTLGSGVTASSLTSVGTISSGVWNGTAIAHAYIGNDAIDGDNIADDSVNSEHYVDGSIDTGHIADNQVTYAKIQNVSATDRILGRDSAGAGVIEEITSGALRTMINVEDGATADQTTADIISLLNTDIGSNFTIGNQTDDMCTFTGPLKSTGTIFAYRESYPQLSLSDDVGSDKMYIGVSGEHAYIEFMDNAGAGSVNTLRFRGDDQTGSGDYSNSDVLTVDFATNRVGIMDTSPSQALDVTGNIAVTGTVDGRDLQTDGTKLDGIEASADVTDTTNVLSALSGDLGGNYDIGNQTSDTATFGGPVKVEHGGWNGILIQNTANANGSHLELKNTTTRFQVAVRSSGFDIRDVNDSDTSRFFINSSGTASFVDNDITNVGNIALDSISSDAGTSINVTLGTDAGDDFIVDTDTLVVEGDNNRVGIGTTSPSVNLHVKDDSGSNTLETIRVENSNGYAELGAQSTYVRLLAGGNLTYAANNSASYFYIGGSVKMGLTSTGLGIGNTSPNHLLHVGDDATAVFGTAPDKAIQLSSTTNDHEIAYILYAGEGTNNIRSKYYVDDATKYVGWDSTHSTGWLGYEWKIAGSQSMTLDTSGNLEISGNLKAVDGDFSGDVDVDGTMEADAITVNGSTLASVIEGTTVTNATNATNATNVAVTANSSENVTHYLAYVDGTSSNQEINVDTGLTWNPSTNVLTTSGEIVTALSMGGHTVDDIDIAGEFVDTNEHLMTSAAIQDKILGYGYTTDTNTNQLTTFVLEDDSGDEVTISHGKEIKFNAGAGMIINWSDTDNGTDGDPFDLDFSVNHNATSNYDSNQHVDHTSVTLTAGDGLTGGGTILSSRTFNVVGGDGITANANDVAIDASQDGHISSILTTALKIGEDDETKIDFETADEIHFYAANVEQVYLADNIFGPQSDSDVDLGTNAVRFKTAYIDSIVATTLVQTPDLYSSSGTKVADLTNDDITFADDVSVANGTLTFGNLSDGSITATAFVDEDDMSSNSATLIPTQQSVKTYVDGNIKDIDWTISTGGYLRSGNTTPYTQSYQGDETWGNSVSMVTSGITGVTTVNYTDIYGGIWVAPVNAKVTKVNMVVRNATNTDNLTIKLWAVNPADNVSTLLFDHDITIPNTTSVVVVNESISSSNNISAGYVLLATMEKQSSSGTGFTYFTWTVSGIYQ